mmetsp:Transcript_35187/g.53993  ORF Transcript_35187/g.53993 Transcript_35187/m.53993 type:complete len:303 (-) Transcript_35187:18-926(-)
MVSLFSRDDRCVRGKHKVDTWVWNKIGLEFVHIHVEGSIETKRGSQRRDNLRNKAVKVGVGWTFNVQVLLAHIIKRFVIKAESTVSVFKKGMGREHGVVWFYNSSGNLWRRRDGEGELGLASVVNGETFKQKGSKTRSSSSSSCVENKESLKASAVVSELANTVEDNVHNFLSNGVMTTGVVIGSILLSVDDLFWVVKLAVLSSTNFVTNSWFQINKNSTWNVSSPSSFTEEGVEGVGGLVQGTVGGHLAIRQDSVLEAVKFPAAVTSLDTGLTQVNRNTFAHLDESKEEKSKDDKLSRQEY